MARLNVHAIFAPETAPELIRSQFISRLVASFTLKSPYEPLGSKWNAVPTRDSLAELGHLIKETIPVDELPKYGSDLAEGFNNWVIPFTAVTEAIDNSSFREKPLIGLGKTEWESIPWNDNTIATKKGLTGESDLIFTAAENPIACQRSVDRLREAEVNYRLLDCSDAHHFGDSPEKDRLGNCFTWICADPTLAGLKHALIEYRSRVFIGERPPLLVRQASDPTNFIQAVKVTPSDPLDRPPPVLDQEIPLNSGFVAVIGNKGSGKSALLDSIALAANSHSEDHFTFLSDRRFRNPRNNKAPHYQVELYMADGASVGPVLLSAESDLDSPERIRYLPQSLLESLCNKEPGSPDDAFEAELRSIIFSHIPEHERLNSKSLDELIEQRGRGLDQEIAHRRAELSAINRAIAELEEQSRPSRLKTLKANLASVTEQISHHDAAKPADPTPPQLDDPKSGELINELDQLRAQLAQSVEEEEGYKAQYVDSRSKLDAANNLARLIEVLQSSTDSFLDQASELAEKCDLDITTLVDVKFDIAPLSARIEELKSEVADLSTALDSSGALLQSREATQKKLEATEALLDEPRRLYEQRRREAEAWSQARIRLVGDATEEGTQAYFRSQLDEADAIPAKLQEHRTRRLRGSEQIHALLLEKVEMFRELYAPVETFIQANQMARESFSLEFQANLEIGEFVDRFLSDIDRGVSSSFFGVDASERRVRQRVRGLQPSSWESVAAFLSEQDQDLHFDRRESKPIPIDCPSDLLRKGRRLADVYDYLYGLAYLDAEYELRSDGRSITELSPGQKGTILLMFYLLVDRSGKPIALDQPDENLDNHTVHTLLRPAIRTAKRNRQVIVVTHSPNLAIVGDADQVIVASSDGKEFNYTSGSIESPVIRDFVVQILEGTWPAFDDRSRKYRTSEFDELQAELLD